MNYDVRSASEPLLYPRRLLRVELVSQWRRLIVLKAQPLQEPRHRFHGVNGGIRPGHQAVIKLRVLIMLRADALSPCHARIQEARRPTVQIHNRIKAAPEKTCCRCIFFPGEQNLVEIGISLEATRKLRFDEHGNAERRKLLLQRADRTREQQTAPHRPKPYKEDASF